jgi:hypothetical protein
MTTVASLKRALEESPGASLRFVFPDGGFIPDHFHVTEVGHVTKDFVDCGGTRRTTSTCVLQTLVAHDRDHRLDSARLASILGLAGSVLPSDDLPVEIEYEEGTTGLYALDAIDVQPDGVRLQLSPKHTACLAPDKCGLEKPVPSEEACDPAGGC